jgi:hypothetical protein
MAGDDDNVQPQGLLGGGQVDLQSLKSYIEQKFNEFREEHRPLLTLGSQVKDLDQRLKVSDANYSVLVADLDSRMPRTMSRRASIDRPNTVDLTGQSTSGPSGVSAEGGRLVGLFLVKTSQNLSIRLDIMRGRQRQLLDRRRGDQIHLQMLTVVLVTAFLQELRNWYQVLK